MSFLLVFRDKDYYFQGKKATIKIKAKSLQEKKNLTFFHKKQKLIWNLFSEAKLKHPFYRLFPKWTNRPLWII